MFLLRCASLALPFLAASVHAIDLDVNSADSIKSTAKTLASAIVAGYKSQDDLIPGLFPDPYYWWEAGAVWNGLVEYSHLTGDSQFNDLVSEALTFQVSDSFNYMPPNQTKTLGNDDQSTWALAALTAAEVNFPKPKEGEWIDFAKNVFDVQVLRWDDESCGGGLKWQIFAFNNGYNYKNTYTSANFFLLSARLAQLTGNSTYSEWADKTFKWTQDVGLISDDFHVYDGTDDTQNCSSINHIQWTYNYGVFTEGAAVMYNLTKGDQTWQAAVSGLLNSSTVLRANETSILSEVACERNAKCNTDQKAFKGIAARSFARAAVAAPFAAGSIQEMLQASAKGAAEQCEGDEKDVTCGLKWFEKDDEAASTGSGGLDGLGETFSAMEVVQALLYPQAKAVTPASGNSGNSTTSPSGTSNSTSSPTGTAAGAAGTGAANKVEFAWVAVFAGAFAMLML